MTLSLRGGGEGAPYTSWGHLHVTQTKLRLDSSHVRKSKTLLDSASRSWIPVCNFWVLESRSWISDSNCYKGIPDSYSCIADSKAQDSGFHKQKFPRSRIPQKKKIPRSRIRHAKIYWIPESALLYMAMGRRDPHDTGRIYDRFKIHVDTEPP